MLAIISTSGWAQETFPRNDVKDQREGDALDYRTNKLTHAYIQGKVIILDNKQEALFERYSKKYSDED